MIKLQLIYFENNNAKTNQENNKTKNNNQKIVEIDDKIMKISTHIEYFAEERENADEPIPIILPENFTENEFDIFLTWFEKLEKFGIFNTSEFESKKIATAIFKPHLFKNCNVTQLIALFNFALSVQIKLLCETIAYCLGQKINLIYVDNKILKIIDDSDVNNLKTINIGRTLTIMILKNMIDEKFYKQNDTVKNILPIERLPVINYTNYLNKLTARNIYPHKYLIKTIYYNEQKYVMIPYNYTILYDKIFYDLRPETINIPSSVVKIGKIFGASSARHVNLEIDEEVNIEIPENLGYSSEVSVNNVLWNAKQWMLNPNYCVPPKNIKKVKTSLFIHDKHVDLPEFLNYDLLTIENNLTIYDGIVYDSGKYSREIIIPDNVVEIGKFAFKDRYDLKTVIIPKSVTKIGYGAFENCKSLKHIYLKNTLSKDTIIDGLKDFKFNCDRTICEYLERKPEFMNSLKSILEERLKTNCLYEELREIIKNVCTIYNAPAKMFDDLLTYLNYRKRDIVPNDITLSSNLEEIEDFAFKDCEKIKSIIVEGSENDKPLTIGYGSFNGCSNFELLDSTRELFYKELC